MEENFIDHNVTMVLEQDKITVITAYGESDIVNFKPFENISCYISNNKRREMFHMEIPKSKDLVMRFSSQSSKLMSPILA